MSLYDYPKKFGLIVFGVTFVLGTSAGVLVGFLIMFTAECLPNDVCDGPAMAAGAAWFVSFWGSLILGAFLGMFSFFVLARKRKIPLRITPL